jgi:SPP1 gp7 family putative phage head morphogenesis protein
VSAPTDVKRFHEAVEALAARLTAAGYPVDVERLGQDMAARAQLLGATAQLDMAAEVWEAIDAAVANGETFEDFRQRISDSMAKSWGRGQVGGAGTAFAANRLDNLFRTNLQRAYSAGRVASYLEPDIAATRPVWKYSAILDSRTSPLCKACAGTVLPASSTWWQSHTPPLHHRCRSTIIALTQRQGDVLGMTRHPPTGQPTEGFGELDNPWRPDLRSYPKPLVAVAKVPKATPKRAAKPPPPPALAVTGTAVADVQKYAPRAAAILGKHLHVDRMSNASHQALLIQLEAESPDVLRALVKDGVTIRVTPGSVVDADLPGGTIRRLFAQGVTTFDGRTWDKVYGVYDSANKRLLVGEGFRPVGTLLHELGHALDNIGERPGVWALSTDPSFRQAHAAWEAGGNRPSYFANHSTAHVETWAEAFALLRDYGADFVARFFSPGIKDALLAVLKRKGY